MIQISTSIAAPAHSRAISMSQTSCWRRERLPTRARETLPDRRFHYRVEPELPTTAETSPLTSAQLASQISSSVLRPRERAQDSTVTSSSTAPTGLHSSILVRRTRLQLRLD